MASQVTPKKNAAYTFYVGLVSQANTKILQANPTLAAGDVKVATDDAAPVNIELNGGSVAVDADFTKRVKVIVAAADMNGDNVTIIFSDAAGSEWCDLIINIQTTARQVDDLSFPTTSGRSMDVSATGEVGLDFDNIKDASGAKTLTNITVPTVTNTGTVTGNVNGSTNSVTTGVTLSAAAVQAIWDALTTALTTAGSIGKKLADWVIGTAQTGDSFARIGVNGAGLTALPWNATWDAEVQSECADALAAINLNALIQIAGAVNDGAPTTSSFITNLTETTNDQYENMLLVFTAGNNAGIGRQIKAYNGTTKLMTLEQAFPEAVANGNGFVLMNMNFLTGIMMDILLAQCGGKWKVNKVPTPDQLILYRYDDPTSVVRTFNLNSDPDFEDRTPV